MVTTTTTTAVKATRQTCARTWVREKRNGEVTITRKRVKKVELPTTRCDKKKKMIMSAQLCKKKTRKRPKTGKMTMNDRPLKGNWTQPEPEDWSFKWLRPRLTRLSKTAQPIKKSVSTLTNVSHSILILGKVAKFGKSTDWTKMNDELDSSNLISISGLIRIWYREKKKT